MEDFDKKYDKYCVAVIPVHYAEHPVPMEILVPWTYGKGLRIVPIRPLEFTREKRLAHGAILAVLVLNKKMYDY